MNVYEVGPDLTAGVLTRVRDDNDRAEWERRYEVVGKPGAADWHPPRLESPRGKAKVLPVDCVAVAMISGADMLLSARAGEALAPLLLPCGEYLPVQLDRLDCRWFNYTALVDVADQDRIEGKRLEYRLVPPNCWDRITRWSFHPERVADAPAVFMVPQRRRIPMCTDVLRQAVEAHDLLGFQFDLLWSPDAGGVEIDDSPAQFLGESGRQWNIAAKERRKSMMTRLAARAKTRFQPEPDTTPSTGQ